MWYCNCISKFWQHTHQNPPRRPTVSHSSPCVTLPEWIDIYCTLLCYAIHNAAVVFMLRSGTFSAGPISSYLLCRGLILFIMLLVCRCLFALSATSGISLYEIPCLWIYDNEIGPMRRLTSSFGELLTFRLALIVRNFSYFPLTCVIWVKLELICKMLACCAA